MGILGDAIFYKGARLTTGGAITNSDGFNMVLFDELLKMHDGLHAFVDWGVGEDGFVMKQRALCVKTDDFTTCTKAWVYAHDAPLP